MPGGTWADVRVSVCDNSGMRVLGILALRESSAAAALLVLSHRCWTHLSNLVVDTVDHSSVASEVHDRLDIAREFTWG